MYSLCFLLFDSAGLPVKLLKFRSVLNKHWDGDELYTQAGVKYVNMFSITRATWVVETVTHRVSAEERDYMKSEQREVTVTHCLSSTHPPSIPHTPPFRSPCLLSPLSNEEADKENNRDVLQANL